MKVIPKRKLRDEGIKKAILEALAGLEGKPVYVSVDADIGAGEQVKAVRFLDTIGLSLQEVAEVAGALGGWLRATGSELAGLDLMEIDVHLADIPDSGDRTVEMCEALAGEIISH